MKLVDMMLRSLLKKAGSQRCETFVAWFSRLAPVDLMLPMYHSRGIHKFQNLQVTGELHLIQNELPRLIHSTTPVIFDVGANVGEFSLFLRAHFPEATIFAFEPIPTTFTQLRLNTDGKSIHLMNFGLGAQNDILTMYLNAIDPTSPMATLHRDALAPPPGGETISSISVPIKTVDAICEEEDISFIDLLKSDTEGHDMSVLKGASTMIRKDKIGAILFEFNSMNIASRVFLKDYYDFLSGYRFYRLDTHRLIPLGPHSHRNEIFEFQNILALNPRIHPA